MASDSVVPILRGVLLSNELPDAFAVEKVRLWSPDTPNLDVQMVDGGSEPHLEVERGIILPLVVEANLEHILQLLQDKKSLRANKCVVSGSYSDGRDLSGLETSGEAPSAPEPGAPTLSFSEIPSVMQGEMGRLRQRSAAARERALGSSWRWGEALRPGAAQALCAWLASRDSWILLSREDYCNIKARCSVADACDTGEASEAFRAVSTCGPPPGRAAIEAAPAPASAISSSEGALEAAFDEVVHIAEVFEEPHGDGATEIKMWVDTYRSVALATLSRMQARKRAIAAGRSDRAEVTIETIVNPAISLFGEGSARIFDSGAVITIDYGADFATILNSSTVLQGSIPLVFERGTVASPPPDANLPRRCPGGSGLRAYSRLMRRGNGVLFRNGREAMLTRPGWCDVTSDVDFTQLAAAGEAGGLRTIYFGPQAGLESAFLPPGGTQVAFGGRMVTAYGYQRTAFGASISRGAADAFYSLGTFMVLVQATSDLAAFGWQPPSLSFPLISAHLNIKSQAFISLLSTLARLMLEIALQVAPSNCAQLDKRELVAALANSSLTTVPCFQHHWRSLLPLIIDAINRHPHDVDGSIGNGASSGDMASQYVGEPIGIPCGEMPVSIDVGGGAKTLAAREGMPLFAGSKPSLHQRDWQPHLTKFVQAELRILRQAGFGPSQLGVGADGGVGQGVVH